MLIIISGKQKLFSKIRVCWSTIVLPTIIVRGDTFIAMLKLWGVGGRAFEPRPGEGGGTSTIVG